ncbi:MAG: PilZ domain-containing protein [Acidobacteria bacterium]|jgi:hypothetical protein|nr:PilZ domain-containing protein [Acidobacteriota bacterium]
MALIVCRECSVNRSDTAPMCPHCGLGMNQVLAELRRSCAGGAAADAPVAAEAAMPGVEKRRHPRIEHRTFVRVDGQTAMLFNVSRSGLKLSSPLQPRPGRVNVELEAGEYSFALQGSVRWVSQRRSFSNLVDFGVEILDPPVGYRDFVEQLTPER